ncbi:L-rhamnose mutarotase [Nitrospirillum amazonense]|uniref:L-rhamnose mutarotase n=1 Tax=Nitrospirillum amazonense TaxID=28077 RepID=A0A560KAM9_9PROT|nr:L-rhamnose mutarotase [Nitrospirillum amazonense]MDG3441214.1 L-rhamnose mutarotase [Nitrospirillum amazonense]TWB80297.1 L-rhamnose mutarotase [Nitrospirillum amazonense]
MNRHVLMLDLKSDPVLIERYRQWHAPGQVPPAVVRAIRQAGILEMEIHLCGDRLAMIVDVTDDYDPAAKAAVDAADPDVQAWEALMDTFQRRLPWAKAGQKWVPADRIFSLAEQ